MNVLLVVQKLILRYLPHMLTHKLDLLKVELYLRSKEHLYNEVQGATWCFGGLAWVLDAQFLIAWGARYSPELRSQPSRHAPSY